MHSFLRRSSLPAPTVTSASPFTHLDRSGHLTPHRSGSTELASPLLRPSSSASSSFLHAGQLEALSHSGDTHLSSSMAQDSPVRRQPPTPPAPPPRVEPLTREAVRRFEQQQKDDEETLFGRPVLEPASQDDARTPAHGALSQGRAVGGEDGDLLHHSRGKEPVEDSEDEDVYNPRIARQIRAFLDSVRSEEALRNPPPLDPAVEAANGDADPDEAAVQRWRRLERMTTLEVRRAAAEAQQELLHALYDAITLETDLAEVDEDAAVLERAVGQRDETLEMLRLQLSTAEEYNEELHEAKKEALRKLSESKTEMALLSQRNAKLLRQLEAKEEELQQALLDTQKAVADAEAAATVAAAAAAAQRAASSPASRCDVGTEAMPALPNASSRALASPGTSNLAYLEQQQREVDEMHRKLELARVCLQSTERAKTDVEVQVQRVKTSVRGLGGGEAADTDRMLRRRCEESEHYAASLEEELRALRSKLAARESRRPGDDSLAASPRHASLSGSFPSGGALPTSPSAPASAARPVSASIAAAAAEAHAALLQRQLDRAQAEARRLEAELHAEREKAQRQSAVEKKLLENVTYLTRRLRDRETTDREARSQRRIEQSTARVDAAVTENDDSSSAPASSATTEGRRISYFPPRTGRLDVACTRAAPGTVTELSDGDGSAPRGTSRYAGAARATSPELRRRRDSVFAALREAQRSSDERRTLSAADSAARMSTASAEPASSLRVAAPLTKAPALSGNHFDAAVPDGEQVLASSPLPTPLLTPLHHDAAATAAHGATCTEGATGPVRPTDGTGSPVRSTQPLDRRGHTEAGAVSPRGRCSHPRASPPPAEQA